MTVLAGFWRRCAAYGIDLTLLALLALPAAWPFLQRTAQQLADDLAHAQQRMLDLFGAADIVSTSQQELATLAAADPAVLAAIGQLSAHLTSALGSAMAVLVLLAGFYFISFEASPWQATPGKRWLGLRVCTLTGQRPSLGRTALRFAAGGLSWLSLNLGHALAAWTPRKQALHDLIAGTVVERHPSPP